MKNQTGLRSVFSALLFMFMVASQFANAQVQTARYISMNTNTKGFYEYLPAGYDAAGTQTYPLILFIHGMGELGDGSASKLPAVLNNGIPKLINQNKFPTSFTVNGKTERFVIISPQFVAWPEFTHIDAVLDYIVSHYKIDVKRIYVTGLSMGGGATWDYGGCSSNLKYVQRVAAIVPVCGASSPSPYRSRTIATYNLPVWALHNDKDPTVPVSYTNDYISLINQAPAPNPMARKTIFSAASHDAWTKAYDPNYKENNMNVYEWMLQYSRPNATGGGNSAPSVNAGADINITLPVNSASLKATATDANGSVTEYAWSKISGPAQYTLSSTTIAAPTLTNLVAGTYTFRIAVKDNEGATGSDDINIVVKDVVAPVNSPVPGKIEAESYSAMSGIQTEGTADAGGGLNVGYIEAGDWMDYNVNVASAGDYKVDFRVANGTGQIQMKKADGSILATTNVTGSAGWQTWTTVSATLTLQAGVQVLRLYASATGFNINWLEFTKKTTDTVVIPPPTTGTKYIKVNLYGGTNPYNNTEWNNWNVSGWDVSNLNSGNLKYSDASASVINATLSHSLNVGDNTASYVSGMAPKEVLRYASYSGNSRTLTIKGLNTSKTYDIELYSSRNSSGNSSVFIVGATSYTINAFNNATTKATFTGLTPNAQGQLVVTINKVNTYSYLNGFTITEGSAGTASVSALRTAGLPEIVEAKIADGTAVSEFNVFPNPVHESLYVDVNNSYTGALVIKILDINGGVKKIFNLTKSSSGALRSLVSLSGLSSGNYIVQAQIGTWSKTEKIVKL